MLIRDLVTIFKILGLIAMIIGLVVYIRVSINNLKEEIEEKIEGLVRKD